MILRAAVVAAGTVLVAAALIRDARHQLRYAQLVERLHRIQFDPAHAGCQAREGRLLAALNREVANVHRLDRFTFAQAERIDQLEHELAASGGPAIVAGFEQYLADQDGGP